MRSQRLFFIFLSFILLHTACSPAAIATSSGQQPTPVEAIDPAPRDTQPVGVDNVELVVGVGSPLPVDIVVSGTWPSQCAQIAEVQSSMKDFQIELTILASKVDTCPPDQLGLPLRFAIPLNTAEMKEGTYTVTVNQMVSMSFQVPVNQLEPTAAILGWVWHDQCVSGLDGQPAPTSTPPGCVEEDSPLGPYHANGLLDSAAGSNEEPIGGVTVRLFEGDCASDSLMLVAEQQTITTDISYSFTGLNAGTYCVSIDPQEDVNLSILRPGIWTYPYVSEKEIGQTVHLQPQEAKYDVNFGWDFQFK